MDQFVEHDNQNARPFVWTATAGLRSSRKSSDYVNVFPGQNTSNQCGCYGYHTSRRRRGSGWHLGTDVGCK